MDQWRKPAGFSDNKPVSGGEIEGKDPGSIYGSAGIPDRSELHQTGTLLCRWDQDRSGCQQISSVWKKSTENNKRKLQEKVSELFKKIDEINEAEEAEYGDKDLEELEEDSEIDAGKLKELAERLSRKLEKDPKNKELKKARKTVETDFIPRMEKLRAL